MRGKYVIIDLKTMDYFKNKNGKIITYKTKDDACIACGIYEFKNVWVCKLIYNHKEPIPSPPANQ